MPDDAPLTPAPTPYLDPYRHANARHGTALGVTLWAGRESQVKRFRVFTELYDFTDKRLLDAGCSRGDLAEYLGHQSIPYAHYTGVDGLPSVIEFAQQRNLPNTTFLAGDLVADPAVLATNQPQAVTISGTLNTMEHATAFAVLEHAWRATEDALLFNFLSAATTRTPLPGEDPATAHRIPPTEALAWALARTPNAVLRHDYFAQGHDATILMRKPAA
ncbi:MAG: class I SAM-dependent methyltransferase [Planctomycetota bacterium]